jgi:alkylhydroperoxidase family enzyme
MRRPPRRRHPGEDRFHLAGTTGDLEPVERAVAGYALQVARERSVDDATFAELKSYLSDAEIADLVLTVAWYHLCAAALGPLQVELEVERNAG